MTSNDIKLIQMTSKVMIVHVRIFGTLVYSCKSIRHAIKIGMKVAKQVLRSLWAFSYNGSQCKSVCKNACQRLQ